MKTKKQKREEALKRLQEEHDKLEYRRQQYQRTSSYYISSSNEEFRLRGEIRNLKVKLGLI